MLTKEEKRLIARGYPIEGTLTNPAKMKAYLVEWERREAIINELDKITVPA